MPAGGLVTESRIYFISHNNRRNMALWERARMRDRCITATIHRSAHRRKNICFEGKLQRVTANTATEIKYGGTG